jgi:hypothetical protein
MRASDAVRSSPHPTWTSRPLLHGLLAPAAISDPAEIERMREASRERHGAMFEDAWRGVRPVRMPVFTLTGRAPYGLALDIKAGRV